MAELLSLEARQSAIRDYIAAADNKAAARRFIAECLDPLADTELLSWLDDAFPDNSQPDTSN